MKGEESQELTDIKGRSLPSVSNVDAPDSLAVNQQQSHINESPEIRGGGQVDVYARDLRVAK